MKYSWIEPKKKSVVNQDFLMILTFFVISLAMLGSTYAFLYIKDTMNKKEINSIIEKRISLQTKISKLKNNITDIERLSIFAHNIQTKNELVKENIKNLFDLIPDSIVLSKAFILKNGLILYGITPNKKIYNYLLYAPLKSIFSKTYTSFYQLDNGWYRFVSTNYMDDEEKEVANAD